MLFRSYFRTYVSLHDRVSDPGDLLTIVNLKEWPWFQRLMGLNDGARFFMTRSMDHKLISSFVQDADVTDRALHPQVTVQSYDGDTLICTVRAAEPLFFTFVDNWDPDWHALVNGLPVPIHKALGTFKSVKLEAGEHRVVFSYSPFSWH